RVEHSAIDAKAQLTAPRKSDPAYLLTTTTSRRYRMGGELPGQTIPAYPGMRAPPATSSRKARYTSGPRAVPQHRHGRVGDTDLRPRRVVGVAALLAQVPRIRGPSERVPAVRQAGDVDPLEVGRRRILVAPADGQSHHHVQRIRVAESAAVARHVAGCGRRTGQRQPVLDVVEEAEPVLGKRAYGAWAVNVGEGPALHVQRVPMLVAVIRVLHGDRGRAVGVAAAGVVDP